MKIIFVFQNANSFGKRAERVVPWFTELAVVSVDNIARDIVYRAKKTCKSDKVRFCYAEKNGVRYYLCNG